MMCYRGQRIQPSGYGGRNAETAQTRRGRIDRRGAAGGVGSPRRQRRSSRTTSRRSESATAGRSSRSPSGSVGSRATSCRRRRSRRWSVASTAIASVVSTRTSCTCCRWSSTCRSPTSSFRRPGRASELLADTGRPVTELYATLLGQEHQLPPLDERLAEINISNPDETDAALAAIFGAEDAAAELARELPDVAAQAARRDGARSTATGSTRSLRSSRSSRIEDRGARATWLPASRWRTGTATSVVETPSPCRPMRRVSGSTV